MTDKEQEKMQITLQGKAMKKFLAMKGKLIASKKKNFSNSDIVALLLEGKC